MAGQVAFMLFLQYKDKKSKKRAGDLDTLVRGSRLVQFLYCDCAKANKKGRKRMSVPLSLHTATMFYQ